MNSIWHDVSWVVPYRNEFLTPIFEAFTWLGYPTFVMILLPLGYWLWSKNKFTRITAMVILATVLNAFLKDYWQNPRPDAIFSLDPGVGDSYGMPSGHAQISAILWFGLAYEIKRSWAWIVATIVVAGIAFSRIYLGIHDLEDIVVGLALAVVCLIVYRALLSETLASFGLWPLWSHLLILVVGFFVVAKAWPAQGHSYEAVSLLGFLVAWLIGAHLDKKFIKFDVREGWVFSPIVALVGIGSLVGILAIFNPVFSLIDPAYTSYLRTIVLGIYMTAGAPLLFKVLSLHKPSSSSAWR